MGRDEWRPARELAVAAFPKGLDGAVLGRLIPPAVGIDLHHYTGTVAQTAEAVGLAFERSFNIPSEFEPQARDITESAKRVQTAEDAWALVEYLTCLVRSRWHERGTRAAEVATALAGASWLPVTGRDGPVRPEEAMVIAPNGRRGLEHAIQESRVPRVDLGQNWPKHLDCLTELENARVLVLRRQPTAGQLEALLESLLVAARHASAEGRAAWEDLAEVYRSTPDAAEVLNRLVAEQGSEQRPFIRADRSSVWMRPGRSEKRRSVVCADSRTADDVRRLLGESVEIVVEADQAIRQLLQAAFALPLLDVSDGRLTLGDDEDLALGLIRSLGARTAESEQRKLSEAEAATVIDAVTLLARLDPHRPWFNPDERAVLTYAGTLEAAETGIFRGAHALVGKILGDPKRHVHRVHRGLADDPSRCTTLGVIDDEGFKVGPGGGISETKEISVAPDHPAEYDTAFREIVRSNLPEDINMPSEEELALQPGKASFVSDITRTLSLSAFDGQQQVSWNRWVTHPGAYIEKRDDTWHCYLTVEHEVKWRKLKAEKEQNLAALAREREREKRAAETRPYAEEIARLKEENLQVLATQIFTTTTNEEYRKAWREAQTQKSFSGLHQRITESRIDELRRNLVQERGYTTSACIFRELIQNVEDAYASQKQAVMPDHPWARFVFSEDKFRLCHAGRRFNEVDALGNDRSDVERILSLGGSEKRSSKSEIGRFGLGFKSIFRLCDQVSILSHPYYFTIDRLILPAWYEPFFDEMYDKDARKLRTDETHFVFTVSRRRRESGTPFDEYVSVRSKLEELTAIPASPRSGRPPTAPRRWGAVAAISFAISR